MTNQADDVSGPGFVDRFAFLAEEFMGGGETNLFSGALVRDDHVAFEFARTDAKERNAVAMLRIHVGLNFEDEAGELRIRDRDLARFRRLGHSRHGDADGFARRRRNGILEKTIEQQLDAEIVNGAAEVHGGLLAGLHRGEIEGMARTVEHLELIFDLSKGIVVQFLPDYRIIEGGDIDGSLVFSTRHALEEMNLARAAIEHALERRTVAQRPDDRRGLEAEDVFEFVQQFDRAARGPVALVHEREDRDAAPTADLEEFARLGFHTLGGVDHHQGGIDSGKNAIGVLGKVLVAGSVEEIDGAAGVIELKNGGRDGDAALFLEFHPVRGGGTLVFAGSDGAGQVERIAVEQELLSQRRFAGIGVRDDGKGAAAGDFLGRCGHDGRESGKWE